MAPKFDKSDGLGVLDSYQRIELRLSGIRKALRNKNRERGIKDAQNHLKDARKLMSKSVKDAKKLQRQTKGVIEVMTKNLLPLIEKKKKSGGK
jgi:hypothetical protein